MSSVQEISTALSGLSREELDIIEKRVIELKGRAAASYAEEEYGLSREELDRFEERMTRHNRIAREQGETTAFPGQFDPNCLD